MANFSPQFGDFDNDGRLDVVSGSNCCDSNWFHWFEVNDDGTFSKRFDGLIQPAPQLRIAGKSESRPYLLDWDRDGQDDFLMMVHENLHTYDEATGKSDYRSRIQLLTNTHSMARHQQIEAGRKSKAQAVAEDLASSFPSGRKIEDVKLELDVFEFEFDEFNQKLDEKKRVVIHFAFADIDNDGNFDFIYSEGVYSGFAENDAGHESKSPNGRSTIYWKRNLTSTGTPRFSKATELFVTDKGVINSISSGDFDGDGIPEIVASIFHGRTRDLQSEIWLLKFE